jgi:hypothetical protein
MVLVEMLVASLASSRMEETKQRSAAVCTLGISNSHAHLTSMKLTSRTHDGNNKMSFEVKQD